MTNHAITPAVRQKTRIRVFVDYWNFQLSLNAREAAERGLDEYRVKVAWKELGPWLAQKACGALRIDPPDHSFEGVIIYASYSPRSKDAASFHKWATTWLNRQPGVTVELRERKPRSTLKCPSCHKEIADCPHPGCGRKIRSTIEKGVDTLIATDMIRLAWENAYDVAILATSDSDLVPAVQFLSLKGLKVIQAGFPPVGVDLATKCWASFDVYQDRKEFLRA